MKIYLDNAATSKMSERAIEKMFKHLSLEYANPSSIYSFARESAKAVKEARQIVAGAINANEDEIFFTSGGTEGDNWAIKGVAQANSQKGKHIISSKIEHHAVENSLKSLKDSGFEITFINVDQDGKIKLDELEKAIRDDTILISVMLANNEIGTIQPIKEIAQLAQKKGIYVHTDAVQAVGHIAIDVKDLGIDILTASAHKFHGPKGVGFQYIKKGTKIKNLIDGGGQEKNRRSGTHNVAGIVAMGEALLECHENLKREQKQIETLRDKLIEGVLKIPQTALTGHKKDRLPSIASFVISAIEGESTVLMLDAQGISASSGSACSTGSLDPSHVLMAIGLTHEVAHGSLRLSLSRYTTEEEIDKVIEIMPEVVSKLRKMSPVWKG